MNISEKELEDLIYDDLVFCDGIGLSQRGLDLNAIRHLENFGKVHWVRQLNIEPYGICDIVGFYRINGCIHVDLIELKIVKIDTNHFEQVARYATGIIEYLKGTFPSTNCYINQILIGSEYEGLYLQNNYPATICWFKYTINGMTFKTCGENPRWHINGDKTKRTFRKNGRI